MVMDDAENSAPVLPAFSVRVAGAVISIIDVLERDMAGMSPEIDELAVEPGMVVPLIFSERSAVAFCDGQALAAVLA